MNPQYEILAKCLLPTHMLEWLELTNASAESLNAKIKDFRVQLRGVIDKKFFIFRLVKIFG